MDDLKILAKDTRNIYGAEAKYKVAQIYFDAGRQDRLRKKSWIILKSALHILIGWRVALCCCLMFI